MNFATPPAEKLSMNEKLELARRLFKENYASCFWHLRTDLEITEAALPTIVKGLQNYGGRREYIEAARLLS